MYFDGGSHTLRGRERSVLGGQELEDQVEELSAKLISREEELNSLRTKLDEMTAQRNDAMAQSNSFEAEVTQLKAEVERLKTLQGDYRRAKVWSTKLHLWCVLAEKHYAHTPVVVVVFACSSWARATSSARSCA